MARKDYQKIEHQKPGVRWVIFSEICKSCGLCIAKCPVKSLSYDLAVNEYLGMPVVTNDIEKCIACGTCEKVCPDCAILLEKKK